MGGKIDCYLDCASPYSYFAFVYLRRRRKVLAEYGVQVEFHPFFLGGVNVATGNKPPSTVPAKGKYGVFDMKRACKFFKTPQLTGPPFFPMLSILPQRCMIYVKDSFPSEQYELAYLTFWDYVYVKHIDISLPTNLAQALHEHFTKSQVVDILTAAQTPKYKQALTETTRKLYEEYGAFGAPWFWIRNDQTGQTEPFFGSDRWAYMWDFLGVPYQDVEILSKEKARL